MNESAYTRSRGRKFAFTLAVAFAVIAIIGFLRDRPTLALPAVGLASFLVILGLGIPERLEPLERAWMKLAHAISRVTTPIFMGIVYFVVLTPVGFVRRIAGANPLVHRLKNDSYWIRRSLRDEEKARRQIERQF